ncbi:MAG: TIGR02301 family protein [Pseudomonadota bacterium]
MVAIAIVLTCCLSIATTRAESPQRPYDTELFRLAENLGGIHYLGALCGRADGQSWRMHMQQLIDSEGSTALRRALLARRFNQGYRNYSRTYRTCSETAKAALSRFIGDAQVLTGRILAYAKPPETPEAPETK